MGLDVESKQTLDEVIDRAGGILTALEARIAAVEAQAAADVAQVENKLIAALQPVLAELQKANESFQAIALVVAKLGEQGLKIGIP
jgi:hypothetical protein